MDLLHPQRFPTAGEQSQAGEGSQVSEESQLQRQPFAINALKWSVKELLSTHSLLILLPLAFAAGFLQWNAILVSTLNFVSIIPLSAIVSDVSGKLANHLGPTAGELINATFGNAVELIVGILAVNHDEIAVAQSTMLGSILSDILLVQGACFVAAAHGSRMLAFNAAVVDSLSSLMIITAVALILPTMLYSTFRTSPDSEDKILSFSRVTSGVLLLIYLIYLYFQFWTHSDIFVDEDDDVDEQSGGEAQSQTGEEEASQVNGEHNDTGGQQFDASQEPAARDAYLAAAVLILAAAAMIICVHFFFDTLDETTKFVNVSKTFVALIIIPFASNAPEGATVIAASKRDKINFAIGVIVGSILQIGLFVLPILVVVGWFLGRAMTLYFETSQTCILFLAVLMVNQILQHGKYTYLHGIMLLTMYAVVAMAYVLRRER